MYTTTFYSFKGGVGRTMSLMNVASDLVAQGRRVLVIDFDLEAPGISTFEPFRSCTSKGGVVDFIETYIVTGEVPSIKDYVQESVLPEGHGALFYLPSGRQDEAYGERLASLNWGDLYENKEGYLLLEDMKAQCNRFFNLDYLLIDSRTGHTDVSGICTRQLPDAVVALFFPNEQNLSGLKTVVQNIRNESSRNIQIHFVPSNVPDLDDEESILADLMSKFQHELAFDEPAVIIHHNNSLSLLNQVLYVRDRPKSSLAREYRSLTSVIREGNEEDSVGAISFINRLQESQAHVGQVEQPEKLERQLEKIFERHSDDMKVMEALLRLRVKWGDAVNGLLVLNALIKGGESNAEYRFRRAMILLNNGEQIEAVEDLKTGLSNRDASYFDLNYAANFIGRVDPTLYTDLVGSSAFDKLLLDAKLRLLGGLAENALAQPFILEKLHELLNALPRKSPRRNALLHYFVICSIALGKFSDAQNAFESEYMVPKGMDLSALFNYSIAIWAQTGAAPLAIIHSVLEIGSTLNEAGGATLEANRNQCLSLAAFMINDIPLAIQYLNKAHLAVDRTNSPLLSAWRYFKVTPNEFRLDLAEQQKMIGGDLSLPVYMRTKITAR